jgi:hypothetical protein
MQVERRLEGVGSVNVEQAVGILDSKVIVAIHKDKNAPGLENGRLWHRR